MMRLAKIDALLAGSILLATVSLAGGSASAGSANLFDQHFAGKKVVCFARTYEAQHLAEKPRQKVTYIGVFSGITPGDDQVNKADLFALRLGVDIRGSKERYMADAYCEVTEGGAKCGIEGDGGQFALANHGDDLELRDIDQGFVLEGSDAIGFGGDASDDGLFILRREDPANCTKKKSR